MARDRADRIKKDLEEEKKKVHLCLEKEKKKITTTEHELQKEKVIGCKKNDDYN